MRKNRLNTTGFTNIVLVLFTFWLGLVVQNWVAEKNASASGALAKAEYVNNVKPIVDSLSAKYNAFMADFVWVAQEKMDDNSEIIKLIEQNDSVIWNYCGDVIKTASKVTCYFGDKAVNDIVVKCGVLYGLKEIHDFYKEETLGITDVPDFDTVSTKKGRIISDSLKFEQRIKNMFNSIEYVSLMGSNPSYANKLLTQHKELYAKLVSSDEPSVRASEEASLTLNAFKLAVEVSNVLNANRTYVQPNEKLFSKIIKSPWSGLLLCVLIVSWIVGRWSNSKKEEDDNKDEPVNDKRFSRFQGQLADLENRVEMIDSKDGLLNQIHAESEDLQKITKEMQNALCDIRKSIEEIRNKQATDAKSV